MSGRLRPRPPSSSPRSRAAELAIHHDRSPADDDTESWQLRAEAWADRDVLIGGSDAGAHLDRMCGAPYPTMFLADCMRGRQLVTPERQR